MQILHFTDEKKQLEVREANQIHESRAIQMDIQRKATWSRQDQFLIQIQVRALPWQPARIHLIWFQEAIWIGNH